MNNITLPALLVFALLGFVAWLGGGRKWAFRTLLSALALLVIGAAGIFLYSYWTDKTAEHRARKVHECAVAKLADPKCEEPSNPSDFPKGALVCPVYTLSDNDSPQQEEEALAAAEQECRSEMDSKEKSLDEQISQYKRQHGKAENKNASSETGPWTKYQQTKITIKDCAARVRRAYPRAYDDLDDAALTKKVLAKYPDYCNIKAPDGFVPDVQGIR